MKRVIVITGVDGSGKSTIARLLAKELTKRNIKVKIVWIKSLHTLAYLTYKLFTKVKGKEIIVNPNNQLVEHYTTDWMKKLGKSWLIIEFVSILPWILLKVVIPSFYNVIICDRYTPDFLATVSLRIGQPLMPWKTIIGRFLMKLSTQTIFLNVNYTTVLRRRVDIEYTENELKLLIALYRLIAKNIGAKTIDTDKLTIKETLREVIKCLDLLK